MASLNNCAFIGNVGKIETRYAPSGGAVTNISLAVNEKYKNKNGEKVEAVEWVKCVAFNKLAEIAEKYVRVGSKLYISGRMKTEKYQDKATGADRYSTKIIANEMQLLDAKISDNSQGGGRRPAAEEKIEDFNEDSIPF